jgi:hypothetical protein
MKPDERTPLPWEWWTSNSHHRLSSKPTGRDGDVLYAYKASDGLSVVNVSTNNAAYIVHACNNYPALLAALIDARELLSWWQGERGDDIHAAVMEMVDAAIREAKGEKK